MTQPIWLRHYWLTEHWSKIILTSSGVLNKSHFTYFSMSYKLIFGPLKELILGGNYCSQGCYIYRCRGMRRIYIKETKKGASSKLCSIRHCSWEIMLARWFRLGRQQEKITGEEETTTLDTMGDLCSSSHKLPVRCLWTISLRLSGAADTTFWSNRCCMLCISLSECPIIHVLICQFELSCGWAVLEREVLRMLKQTKMFSYQLRKVIRAIYKSWGQIFWLVDPNWSWSISWKLE